MEPLNRSYERKRISTICFGVLLLLAAALLSSLVLSALVSFFVPELIGSEEASRWIVAVGQYIVAFPISMILVSLVPRDPMEKYRWSLGQTWRCFLIACALMYIGGILGGAANLGLSRAIGYTPPNVVDAMLGEEPLFYTILLTCVLAPVMEELLFRKMLIDRLNRLGDRPAIWISALIFALFHGNLYQFFYALFVGWLFAYIYVRTGRIRYTIFLHILVNTLFGAVPILLEFLHAPMISGTDLDVALLLFLILELILAVAGLVTLIRSRRRVRLLRGWVDLPKFRWGSIAFGNWGMWVLLLGCAGMFAFNIIVA